MLHSLGKEKHTGQTKHDSQNIFGCVRLSDLIKTICNREDLDIVMPIYKLLEYSDIYSMKLGISFGWMMMWLKIMLLAIGQLATRH